MAVSSTFVSADGQGYELQMGRWSRRLAPLFVEFTGIDAADCVLDVGCGTGSLSARLIANPRTSSVRGIDLSPVYIEHAKRHNGDDRLDFKVGDACTLPFPDGSFDRALSMLVLQFIPQPERAVREMRRVTRPGGKGRYHLIVEDVRKGTKFSDAIARTSWPIEQGYVWEPFGDEHVHYVPFGSLVPAEAANIVAAGRCIDADGAALSSVRVMGPCIAMGAAAAHARDLAGSGSVAQLDMAALRARLRDNIEWTD
jgi:SAM-dependent methyltransferase